MSTDGTRRGLGLRGRVMLTFAVGAALVSLLLAVSVFTVSRGYLLEQRERSAHRLTSADADFVESRLAVPGSTPQEALTAVDPPADTILLLFTGGAWVTAQERPATTRPSEEQISAVRAGAPNLLQVTVDGKPYLSMGVELDNSDLYFEYAPVVELRSTIQLLGTVLAVCAVAATAGAALLGLWASRRVLLPLRPLAGTASSIAAGNLDSRLPEDGDPDLGSIVTSFNTMVDSLQERIERERRFVGDVTHELRTPLTTLVTSVEVMRQHADELPERPRRALLLVGTELDHLRGMLDDLLALASAEAGLHHDDEEPFALAELLRHALAGHSGGVLRAGAEGRIRGHKLALLRAFSNLVDNADRHGGGVTAVHLREAGDRVLVDVDDRGPGIPAAERDRVFQRFATARGARGSSAGTGLGLALVAETVAAHRGTVTCVEGPGGGARFTVVLPLHTDDDPDTVTGSS